MNEIFLILIVVGIIYVICYAIVFVVALIWSVLAWIFKKWSGYTDNYYDGVDTGTVQTISIIITAIIILGLIVIFIAIIGFSESQGNTKTPTPAGVIANPPISETPFIPAASQTTTPDKKTYETAWQDDERFRTVAQKELIRVGSLIFEYTPIMQPETSETFYLQVYIPQEYASIRPLSFERIFLPPTHANNPSNLSKYTTSLLVYPIISAQLESTDFQILPLDKQSTKILDVTDSQFSVNWKWVVQAPISSGRHTLALSIFIDKIPDPSWTGSFTIDVQPPTATPPPTSTQTPVSTKTLVPTTTPTVPPTPTMTPTPTILKEFGDSFRSDFIDYIIGLILTIVIPAIFYKPIKTINDRRKKIKTLEKELKDIQDKKKGQTLLDEKRIETERNISDRISKLKAIQWKFWKQDE